MIITTINIIVMAILNCCLNFLMMQMWNCLEVSCTAATVFTRYFLHWSLWKWNSALLTVLLLSPTAIITSTNIHMFHAVYLMEHINCLCCCLDFYSLLFTVSRFFLGNAVLKLHTHYHLVYCIFATEIVCHFLCSLMAFDCQEIKNLLTYLFTYLLLLSTIS